MNIEGPSDKIQNTSTISELSLQDIIILKRFLEKGSREKIFIQQEQHIATCIQKKLGLVINKFLKKQQEQQKINQT